MRPDNSMMKAVTLPDDWIEQQGQSIKDVWYRIEWQNNCEGQTGLLFESIVLAGEIFVNDDFLWRDNQLTEPLSRSWNMPRYWVLPDALLKDDLNTIWVRVISAPGYSIGLGKVHIGEAQFIETLYQDLFWNRRTVFEINIIVSGIIGILFFVVWVADRQQTAYGWYAFSSLCWVLFAWNLLALTPWPLPGSLSMIRINTIAILLCVTSFCIFTWRIGQKHFPSAERIVWIMTATLAVLNLFSNADTIKYAQTTSFLYIILLFAISSIIFIFYSIISKELECMLTSVFLTTLIVAAIHDIFFISNRSILTYPLLPYTNIVITLCLATILGIAHARNVNRIRRFNHELTESVTSARQELTTALEGRFATEKANIRLQERLQLANDLHDGLGGTLVQMMASLEQTDGPLTRQRTLSMLKLVRDDLRQTIDTNTTLDIKVPATPSEWVAPLRYRFSNLFDELDIKSEWVYPNQWSVLPQALQCLTLTRVVEEALTNIIKHSRASCVCFRFSQSDKGEMILEIEDNGVGFDVDAVRRSGLSVGMRSMGMRIERLRGKFTVLSEPGKTIIRCVLNPREETSL